jgi:hypothetical protein
MLIGRWRRAAMTNLQIQMMKIMKDFRMDFAKRSDQVILPSI